MGSLVPIIHRNTAPPNVPSTVAPTIWMTSSMLAYSHKLLYRRNVAKTTTLINARIPSTKYISLLTNTSPFTLVRIDASQYDRYVAMMSSSNKSAVLFVICTSKPGPVFIFK